MKTRKLPVKWPGMDILGWELKSGLEYSGKFGSFSLNPPELTVILG